jgi:uncharacterized protein YjbI with pentapeptide repeats
MRSATWRTRPTPRPGSASCFSASQFAGAAAFGGATFLQIAEFADAVFRGRTEFSRSAFREATSFRRATFGDVAFQETAFDGPSVDFRGGRFAGETRFTSRREGERTLLVFAGVQVDFREVAVDPAAAVCFLEADLRLCRFLGTDLERIRLARALWGHGERFLRPLLWCALLLGLSTLAYLMGGLVPAGGGAPLLALAVAAVYRRLRW